jgi:hypothetical protein
MAESERSKNLPLAAGSCYEGKGCGRIEQARRRSKGIFQAALGGQQEIKFARQPTAALTTLGSSPRQLCESENLWFRVSRDVYSVLRSVGLAPVRGVSC